MNRAKAKRERKAADKAARVGNPEDRAGREVLAWLRNRTQPSRRYRRRAAAGGRDPAAAGRTGVTLPGVRILGVPWDVIEQHGEALGLLGEVERVGAMQPHKRRITVDVDQHPDAIAETYLHELTHALLDLAGLRQELGVDKDEAVANRLAPLLLHTLRDNPDVVAWLTGTNGQR